MVIGGIETRPLKDDAYWLVDLFKGLLAALGTLNKWLFAEGLLLIEFDTAVGAAVSVHGHAKVFFLRSISDYRRVIIAHSWKRFNTNERAHLFIRFTGSCRIAPQCRPFRPDGPGLSVRTGCSRHQRSSPVDGRGRSLSGFVIHGFNP